MTTTKKSPNPDTCPSEELLERFLGGQCDPTESAKIGQHLRRCERCRDISEKKRGEVDEILKTVRQAVSGDETKPDKPHGEPPSPYGHFKRMPSIPDYELHRRLGRGAFGEVWLAENRNTGIYHAVKLIPTSMAMKIEHQAIRDLERLTRPHPHRVEIRHVGRTDECLFYVMALADSYTKAKTFSIADYEPRTLESDLKRRGALPLTEAVRTAIDVMEGLGDLHAEGLLHRDVKPANIVFVDGRAQLGDLGLVARAAGSKWGGGTPKYSPPEGVKDHTGDLYCVGRMLCEMIAGELPNGPAPIADAGVAKRDSRAKGLTPILRRATAAEKKNRFQTVEQFQRELELWLEPTTAPTGVRQRGWWTVTRGVILGLIIVAMWISNWWPVTGGALKGQLQIWVEDAGGRFMPRMLDESMIPLAAGQKVQLRAHFNRPLYPVVALVSYDTDSAVQIVYPRAQQLALQQRVTELNLPSDGAWPLTPAGGMLSFVVLARERPIADLERLHRALAPLVRLPAQDRATVIHLSNDEIEVRRNPDAERPKGFPDARATTQSALSGLEQIRTELRNDFDLVEILIVPQIGKTDD